MSKRSSALALEQKILTAIESGEFTPARGYYRLAGLIPNRDGMLRRVEIGPCGCALAAAGSVSDFKPTHADGDTRSELIDHLVKLGVSVRDCNRLEDGYESEAPYSGLRHDAYYQLGRRLRRFHPNRDGFDE